jgi:large exoprotein involved in heme utilization and adhesion
MNAPSVNVSGSAQVSTFNSGTQGGAAIQITSDALTISDGGGILSENYAAGSGGKIGLDVGSLSVTGEGRIFSDTTGGLGGSIDILAERVLVSNATNRPNGTFVAAKNGGSIRIDADLVELLDGGQIFTRAEGAVAAGSLSIINADRVFASGIDLQNRPSGLFSRAAATTTAGGDGGLLSVQTRILELDNGATFSASTAGAGNAGDMVLDASERMSVRGGINGSSIVASSVLSGSTGVGGDISIDTDWLELRDGGQVSTSTFGPTDAGSIDAHARVIAISGVDPFTGANRAGFFSQSEAGGNGGVVALNARQSISMFDQALISTSSKGTGLAGDILVTAGEQLDMQDSLISTSADISAGGNVEISAADLVFLDKSAIQTLVKTGAGGGGNVSIDSAVTVLHKSNVKASAIGGPGGNIRIDSDFYFQSADSFLDASSREDVAGRIDIPTPNTALIGSLHVLPASYLDASLRLDRSCAARSARAGSFVVQARESALDPPDAVITPSNLDRCSAKEEMR